MHDKNADFYPEGTMSFQVFNVAQHTGQAFILHRSHCIFQFSMRCECATSGHYRLHEWPANTTKFIWRMELLFHSFTRTNTSGDSKMLSVSRYRDFHQLLALWNLRTLQGVAKTTWRMNALEEKVGEESKPWGPLTPHSIISGSGCTGKKQSIRGSPWGS